MIIQPFPYSLTFLDGEMKDKSEQKRSPGLHLSHIIRDIANRVVTPGKRSNPETLSAEETAQMNAYTIMGFSWESIIEAEVARRIAHQRKGETHVRVTQEEYMLDGIWMTPDALVDDGDGPVKEEYKATWKTARKLDSAYGFESDFFEWRVQSRCYCKLFETRRARFIVLWVNGDYKPIKPKATRYEITYDQAEIDRDWNMVKQHAKFMKENQSAPK